MLLAPDRPEGEPGDGDGDHQRPEPVEASGGLFVARFRYEPDGGQVGDQQEGEVDQEGHAPGDGVHQQAPDERAEDGRGARRAGPQAKGPSLLLALKGGGDDGERAGDQEGAGGALQRPADDQELYGGRDPAQQGGGGEADEADGEHAPSAEVVAERPGQDQQRTQGDEVAVGDIGLRLKRPEQLRGQFLADPGQGEVHDRGVEEDDA
jgi:hypothetical protein